MPGKKPDLILQRQDVILFADHTTVVDLTQDVRSGVGIAGSAGSVHRIAYINAEKVFQDYKRTGEAVETFRAEEQKRQQELKTLRDRFKRGLISERTFQQESARLQQEMQRLDQELTAAIQGSMIKAIAEIAQAGRIDWVTQRKDVVLFANPAVVLDLTDLVIRKLNDTDQPIVSLALIEPGVDLLLEAGMERIRAKSLRQTGYLIALWESLLEPVGFTLNSPRDSQRRGSHISLGHPEGLRIDLALINDCGVLPDFRAPDNIRLGIAPLYTSYADIHAAAVRMRRIVDERLYERYPAEAPVVT